MTYMDVSLAPDDVEWDRWPDREDVKDACFDRHLFELFVVEHGLVGALERVTQFHREVANQLIRRAVDDPLSSRWAGRTIWLCRHVKSRRDELRRMLYREHGYEDAHAFIDGLDRRWPRAMWGVGQ